MNLRTLLALGLIYFVFPSVTNAGNIEVVNNCRGNEGIWATYSQQNGKSQLQVSGKLDKKQKYFYLKLDNLPAPVNKEDNVFHIRFATKLTEPKFGLFDIRRFYTYRDAVRLHRNVPNSVCSPNKKSLKRTANLSKDEYLNYLKDKNNKQPVSMWTSNPLGWNFKYKGETEACLNTRSYVERGAVEEPYKIKKQQINKPRPTNEDLMAKAGFTRFNKVGEAIAAYKQIWKATKETHLSSILIDAESSINKNKQCFRFPIKSLLGKLVFETDITLPTKTSFQIKKMPNSNTKRSINYVGVTIDWIK